MGNWMKEKGICVYGWMNGLVGERGSHGGLSCLVSCLQPLVPSHEKRTSRKTVERKPL